MGGSQGGQPLHSESIESIDPEPGSQPGVDWGDAQSARDQQARERQDETQLHPNAESGPMRTVEDGLGTTTKPGTAAKPRY